MNPVRQFLLASVLPLLALPLSAAEVIQGVTATASSEWSVNQAASNLVNNSGIVTAGSTPANQTPAPYDITAVHTYDQSAFAQWHDTGPADTTNTITFDLGGSFEMDAIHIWNGNQWSPTLNLTARGVQQFDVLVSSDGTNFTEVLTDQVLTKSPGNQFVAAQSFSLAGNSGVTHVRLHIDSNHGDAYRGLSEVMFTQTVDPGLSVPASLDFGTVSFNGNGDAQLVVNNTGATQPLLISSVALEGSNADFFSIESFPTSIAAGASGTIELSFDPDGFTGDFFAVLVITSNKGGFPGTLTEVDLNATSVPDPLIAVLAPPVFPRILPTASVQRTVTVANDGLTQPLLISAIALAGADAGKFTVDSFPASIAPGSTGEIVVSFVPAGEDGNYSATLEITCNDAGIPDSVIPVALQASTDLLALLSQPAITAAAAGFNSTFGADKLFDGTAAEFATFGGGAGSPLSQADGTWVELDFGTAVTMDRMILATRGNNADVVGISRLILSDDPVFEETDTVHVFDPTGTGGQGLIQSFPTTTARYARWEVTTSVGFSQNLGGMEMRFLDTPAGWYPAPATVIGGATPFSPDYALDNAVDGDAGRSPGVEYASQSLGAAMFVDFDLGSSKPVIGFDLFDRIPQVDRTLAFDLLFSDDPTFTTGVTTLSFSPGSDGWGYRRNFAAITARYIRLDATLTTGFANNSGIQEMVFYSSSPGTTGTPFEQYISGTWGLEGADAAADFDYDGDGLDNAIEFVLGSDPTDADTSVQPTAATSPTQLGFTFRRSSASAADSPAVEYGSDLGSWTTAVDGVDGVTIVTIPDGFGAGIDSVTVNIPRALAVDGRLFARLAVEVATTP
jgi:hypothetical protein